MPHIFEARMAITAPPNPAADYFTDMAAFVTECAEADAVRVGEFLRQAGIAPPPGQTRTLPAAHLLDLGAAMRIAAWEEAGADVHREAGLPTARAAFLQVLRAPTGASRRPAKGATNPIFLTAVLRLLIERFAWSGQRDLGAEMVLDAADEDQLVETLAQFLWTHRHLATTPSQGRVQ